MRKLQTACATVALLLTLTATSLAGEMPTPNPPPQSYGVMGTPNTPPQVNGEMGTPQQQVYGEMDTPKSSATLEPLTGFALTALQSLLTLF